MTTLDSSSPMGVTKLPAPPFWVCVLLGLVMIVAGFFVLGDVMLVTVISTIFIGWVAIIAGAFEIVHAFWTKGWGGFIWQVLLGILYVAFGAVLVSQPVASALILTYVLGLMLLISGFIRILLGIRHWREAGWIMLLSGVFGVLAGDARILRRNPGAGCAVARGAGGHALCAIAAAPDLASQSRNYRCG